MAESKYGKYILRDTGGKEAGSAMPGVIPAVLEGRKDWSGIRHRIDWKYISQPALLEKETHAHSFEEFWCFLGCDPAKPQEFGAEIEISLGKEGERHKIDAPSVVCISGGLEHGPLEFKKISRPVLFCDIYLSPETGSKEEQKNG